MAGAGPGSPAATCAGSSRTRRWIVLSDQEQRSWDEIERSYAAESGTRTLGAYGIRAVAVGAVGVAIMLAMIGAPWAGLVVVAAPALGWLLWRYRTDIGGSCTAALVSMDGWVAEDAPSQRPGRSPEADREVR
jgi:hypothetical protein